MADVAGVRNPENCIAIVIERARYTFNDKHTSVKAMDVLSRDHQNPLYRSISSWATKSARP